MSAGTAGATRDGALEPPVPGVIPAGDPDGSLRDVTLQGRRARVSTDAAEDGHGGTYTASTGERVVVYHSPDYPPNDPFNQAVANFLAGLVHGGELAQATVYMASPSDINEICGGGAVACYLPREELLVSPAEDPPDGSTMEDALVHEYGHHLANNRRNDPWSAYDWGTKRWASRIGVCPRVVSGAWGGSNYSRDPAEGFAEAYTVLNGGGWGGIVINAFYPDAGDKAALRADVLNPWRARRRSTTSFFVPRGALRRRTVQTPLDGRLTVKLRGPRRTDFDLGIFSLRGRLLAKSTSRTSVEKANHIVCGEASVRAAVHAYRGKGRARLTIIRP